jgi:chemosensory pili system protein ChpA (sensor histidine kinase/response regulator)
MNRELQLDLMRVRMVPVGSIVERLHRIVRQTAKELGRRANLDLVGEAVEVDRSVLERMIGPLEHLLRNAVTYGIEAPEARRAAGKPDTGEIRLEVRQEGQEVILTLADDGAGLDLARIRDKALSQGLLRAGETVDDRALADLIFLPGFSTAQAVTEVAGRGVGMDVVKNEVSGLGGRIELLSMPGQGARFVVRLPLTTAVAQAVLVRSGERTCALPAVMVEQVQQLRAEQLERIRAAGQVEWANRRYPFHYLPELLGEPGEPPGAPKKHHSVLLLRAGAEAIALLVDDMSGNQEVVVKNIGPQLARVPGVTGATVLGTGEVVLIMNPVQLATGPRRQLTAHGAAAMPVQVATKAAPAVMVVDDSLTVRKITGRLLAREGYEVLTAKDGVDALEQLKERLPDVMLVDIEMPRMDGFELTRNVRGDARMKSVPIIMITSRTADKHRNYAAELGVNVYLGKPYQEDELLGHIAGFVGR